MKLAQSGELAVMLPTGCHTATQQTIVTEDETVLVLLCLSGTMYLPVLEANFNLEAEKRGFDNLNYADSSLEFCKNVPLELRKMFCWVQNSRAA